MTPTKAYEYPILIHAYIALETPLMDFEKAQKKLRTMKADDVIQKLLRVEKVRVNYHRRPTVRQ